MSTETGFNTDWLQERFVFDNRARNVEVENACLSFFKHKKVLNIIDLGSGSGASFLYLVEKFNQDQHWTFVELNPQLAKASLDRIVGVAHEKKWPFERKEKLLNLQLPHCNVTIQVVNGSFLELEDWVDLSAIDLATAAAVFDLLSLEMLQGLLHLLVQHGLSLLSTINYAGMRLAPGSPEDIYYADLYSKHMQRDQPFGRSLGSDCSKEMIAWFVKNNIQAISGASNWHVGPGDGAMHHFLLEYIEGAVPEMLSSTSELRRFIDWSQQKRALLENGDLEIEVLHFDLFAPGLI